MTTILYFMKRFPIQILTALGFVTVMIMVGLWASPKLMAAVKAALVQNVDEPGRNPYQEMVFLSCFPGYAGIELCTGGFTTVPTNSRLVITHISGEVSVLGGGIGDGLLWLAYAGTSRTPFPLLPGGLNGLFVNEPVLAYFEAGQIPQIQLGFTNPASNPAAFITLAGYYVRLN